MDRVVHTVDRAQQHWPVTAYPYAVLKKFGDDQAGNLAALMAYYGFLAVFPLLLVFATVLAFVLKDNPDLQQRILHSALVEFPVIGDQIQTKGLNGHWYVLIVSVGFSLWGAQGVAGAAQNAFNTMWNVPYSRRPGFPAAMLRSFGMLGVGGIAVVCTGLLSGIGSATGPLGILVRISAFGASAVVNVGIFLLAFRLAIANEVPLRDFARAAVISAVVWQVLLAVGTLLVAHQVRHQQELYGVFGVVLGLLAWLHLQAQLTLLAVEADVVRARRMWPRSVAPPPLTAGDRRAYRAYVQTARRRPADEQDVNVRFLADPVREHPQAPAPAETTTTAPATPTDG
jgi:YihY family inner membrane protein